MSAISDDRLAELTNRLENGIRELYASGRYPECLAAMSKFNRYPAASARVETCDIGAITPAKKIQWS